MGVQNGVTAIKQLFPEQYPTHIQRCMVKTYIVSYCSGLTLSHESRQSLY